MATSCQSPVGAGSSVAVTMTVPAGGFGSRPSSAPKPGAPASTPVSIPFASNPALNPTKIVGVVRPPITQVAQRPSDTISGAVQEFLSAELGVALGDVQVISATPAEFTDSCLGLGGPAESCLQAITPGWLVMVDVAGQQYEVHTDATGEQVRVAEDVPADDGAANTAVAAAQEYLVAQLGVALGDVQVISAEPTEFSDGCLGLGRPDESCLQAITPGWLIMVEVAGQEYEVRTDQTGQQVRMAQ